MTAHVVVPAEAEVVAVRRPGPDWRTGLLMASLALGACLAAAGALAWISRQTGHAVDKIAFNFPYDDEENWFV